MTVIMTLTVGHVTKASSIPLLWFTISRFLAVGWLVDVNVIVYFRLRCVIAFWL